MGILTHGSLFSGFGGAELAAAWMGWENVFHCENNKYSQKILKQHFPASISYEDIKTTEFIQHRGRIDILTGGFPCQPFSRAGKRKGTEDDRHLWPQMLRAIGEIQPVWILGENVPGITNWSKGMVFEQVQADMEAAGYEAFPALNLPACSLDASHTRERIWFVAHSLNHGHRDLKGQNGEKNSVQGIRRPAVHAGEPDGTTPLDNASDPNSDQRCERGMHSSGPEKTERYISPRDPRLDEWDTWENFPTEPPLCRRDDGISHRLDRIKGLGNAWVPQVAYQIFKAIEQLDDLIKSGTL